MSFKKVDVWQAKELLQETNTILVDVRDKESFTQSHASGAIHLSSETLPDFIQSIEKQTSILVMCYHGNNSQMVAQYLTKVGFDDVYSINGGYEAWR